MVGIKGETLAHFHAKTLRHILRSPAKWRMLSNQKQSATSMNPVANRVTFFISEGGPVRALVVYVFSAKSVSNHQDLESVERFFGKALVVAHHVIPIVHDQIGKGLVTADGDM